MTDERDDSGGGIEEVRRADEVLQVMFWMRGEELGERVAAEDLDVFLGREVDPKDVGRILRSLEQRGLVEQAGDGRFRLTEHGVLEGGRRFADEFTDLTGQAHGECSDPTCDCHTDPAAALECHRERHAAHGGHAG